ncbi:OmpA family protein [Vibrio aquaticus]|uniref:OmpA family protein n=1 Tax=Vibrio aquaticus TaxID=2496559 RepID=A0A3S0P4R8_9VIBR|nr:OmpA family protein [Vibrio aquaticus]RTZ14467.1 OmpA family protein [Vibrio aquaticus]
MNNQKLKWVLLAALPMSSLVMANTATSDVNEALYYYCHQGSNEYQEQVLVGESQRVMYHQGPFMQITAKTDDQTRFDSVKKELEKVGVESNCAQYLLSHAVVDENEQWQQELTAQVLFDFDKSNLNAQSRYLLSQVKARIEQGESQLKVLGHTDSKGEEAYNLKLGMKRADTVKTYLDQDAKAGSEGESHPLKSNDSAQGRHLNRRVEVELLPKS